MKSMKRNCECEECEGTGKRSFYECDELVDCVDCSGKGTIKMNLYQREIASGLRLENPPDLSSMKYNPSTDAKLLSKKIKWVNALRGVVARRMPVNNSGWAVVSDVDLLLATEAEREEALEVLMKGK